MEHIDKEVIQEAVKKLQDELLEGYLPEEMLLITMASLADQLAAMAMCDIQIEGWDEAIEAGVKNRIEAIKNKKIH